MDFFAFAFDAPDAAVLWGFLAAARFFFGFFVPKIAPNREPRSDIDLVSIANRRPGGAGMETGDHRGIQVGRFMHCSLSGVPDRLMMTTGAMSEPDVLHAFRV
ncbi:MAG TPA: hypothetical protein VFP05_19145 [Thermomicrobiales bacterium]|nr:hypothetical protein [Thermomicrobiales bacterium]